MAAVLSLQPWFLYGLNSGARQNAHFVSDEEILYPAGGVLVLQRLGGAEPRQTYVHLRDKQRPLDVLCISPDKELVAVGEGGESPGVSLYSVSSRQLLCTLQGFPAEIRARRVACLHFSCDGQYVVAVTGAPDWMLLCFSVTTRALDSKTRANMAAQPDGEVSQVSCNPADASTLAVVGPGLFRLLQLVDGSWRQFGFHKAQMFPLRSVSWLTADRLLAGTEDGRLLLVESNELKAVFVAAGLERICLPAKDAPVEETMPGPSSQSVTAIVAHGSGFLLGLGNPCEVLVFRHEQGAQYLRLGTFSPPEAPHREDASDPTSDAEADAIWWLALSPGCTLLLASSVQTQLYTAPLVALQSAQHSELEPLGERLHRGSVAGVSMSVWRPVFASCGLHDRSVRLWNYTTGRQELAKTFSTQPLCVAMHPLGLFLLVGFAHSVCLLAVQLSALTSVRELAVRDGCRLCRFSHGGQLFAVAHGSRVHVVSAVTFDTLHALHGHCAQVEGLAWSGDDSRLVTCGADGAVYEWDVASGRRLEELVTKGVFYQGLACLARSAFLVAGDHCVKEVARSQLVREVACHSSREVCVEPQLTVALTSRSGLTLLLASRCGAVLATPLPLEEEGAAPTTGACMHSAPVTTLAMSHDGSRVVSSSEDGSLCVWRLQQPGVSPEEPPATLGLTDELVLVGRGELTELSRLAEALAERLARQHEERDAALHREARTWQQQLQHERADHRLREAQIVERMQEGEERQRKEVEAERDEAAAAGARHEAAVAALEGGYEARLLAEYRRVEELERALSRHTEEAQREMTELKTSHGATLTATRAEYDQRLEGLERLIEEERAAAARAAAVHEEVLRQVEEDADKEIVHLRVEHERALRAEKQRAERLAGELHGATKRIEGGQQERAALEARCEHLQEEVSQQQATISGLEQHIAEQRRLMHRNNIILEDKERDLAEVRGRVSELLKEKDTLVFRMELLNRHVGPKEQALQDRARELDQMGNELREERRRRAQLEVERTSVTAQLRQAQRCAAATQSRARDTERDVGRLRARVHELGAVLQQPRRLTRLASELYREHGQDGDCSISSRSGDALQELRRQLEGLRELNNALLAKIRTLEAARRTEKNALKQECVYLMKELEAERSKEKNKTAPA